jgi:hypothetical protein
MPPTVVAVVVGSRAAKVSAYATDPTRFNEWLKRRMES